MTGERDATLVRPAEVCAAPERAPADWVSLPGVARVLERLAGTGPACVARAPGRLDVIGGLAEYTGGLVVNTPIAQQVHVAVRPRSDGAVSIDVVGADGSTPHAGTLLPADRTLADAVDPIAALNGRGSGAGPVSGLVRCVAGALFEMVRGGLVRDLGGGVSVAIGSELDELSDVGAHAAAAAATLVATASALDVSLEPAAAAMLCQTVENRWIGVPVGAADSMCALVGRAGALGQWLCCPCTAVGSTALPDGVALVGIDCGAKPRTAAAKYRSARTASFMGRVVIERIVAHEGYDELQWNGYVSNLSVEDYILRFRDRIPKKISGRAFLDLFAETGDPLTRVDPSTVYNVRSRTEHHIYENARAHGFVGCLARAQRKGDGAALGEAGKLMYASHWSYGQRCGLGSVETDLLVGLVRRFARDAGVFGAKITGRGGGGVVVVLMRTTDAARGALDEAMAAYREKTKRTPCLITGSLPGAIVTGAEHV